MRRFHLWAWDFLVRTRTQSGHSFGEFIIVLTMIILEICFEVHRSYKITQFVGDYPNLLGKVEFGIKIFYPKAYNLNRLVHHQCTMVLSEKEKQNAQSKGLFVSRSHACIYRSYNLINMMPFLVQWRYFILCLYPLWIMQNHFWIIHYLCIILIRNMFSKHLMCFFIKFCIWGSYCFYNSIFIIRQRIINPNINGFFNG